MPLQLWRTTSRNIDDFILLGSGANTIDGGGGDDYILGDSTSTFGTGTSEDPANPYNIDNAARWTTDENPFFGNASIPHTSLYVAATEGQIQYASVTVGAGETITIDIDFGQSTPIGGAVDTTIQLLSGSTPVATNDDASTALGGGGSLHPHDSYLTYTNTSGSSQVYTIAFTRYYLNPFQANQTFVANISVSGHDATASVTIGDDILAGGDGDDALAGQGGNDMLSGGAGRDHLYGGSGNDILDGGADIDAGHYEDATTGVTVDLRMDGIQQDTVGAGLDTLISIEDLVGSQYADTLNGSNVANIIHGGFGNDTIYGHAGDDVLYGEDGDDNLQGGDGSDVLYADDNYTGVWGNNTLSGGAGNDTIYSYGGNDIIDGGGGNDIITDTGGNDTISGGAGVDLLRYWNINVPVTVDLRIKTAQDTGGAGVDTITGVENLIGGNGADTLMGNGGANDIRGYGGDDTIYGLAGDDILNGEVGNDTILGGVGNDTIDGDDGADTIIGEDGDDTIYGGDNADTIYAGDGSDTVYGGAGSDAITGGAGDDWLYGRGGNDTLTGGSGADMFVFDKPLSASGNVDQIVSFNVADDTIVLDDDVFTAVGAVGELSAGAFVVGTAAADASDRIIYDSVTGNIYYDADGDGPGGQVLFAHVDPGLPLTHSDFQLVG